MDAHVFTCPALRAPVVRREPRSCPGCGTQLRPWRDRQAGGRRPRPWARLRLPLRRGRHGYARSSLTAPADVRAEAAVVATPGADRDGRPQRGGRRPSARRRRPSRPSAGRPSSTAGSRSMRSPCRRRSPNRTATTTDIARGAALAVRRRGARARTWSPGSRPGARPDRPVASSATSIGRMSKTATAGPSRLAQRRVRLPTLRRRDARPCWAGWPRSTSASRTLAATVDLELPPVVLPAAH